MRRPARRNDHFGVQCLPVLLGLAVAGSALLARTALGTGAADANTVLILGKTVVGGANSLEATTATARSLTVEVANDANWLAKSAADFATYRAIILGDPDCVEGTNPITAAVSNKNVWGSAITGNIMIVGTDPASHVSQGGDALTDAAIAFATERPGRTGAYISLSCYYLGAASGTAVPVLDGISPAGFAVSGVGCFNTAHLVATDPGISSLTDATLSDWNCSLHDAFDKWPADFLVVGMVINGVGTFTASDGTAGTPYIVARGLQLTALGLSLTPTAGLDLVGTVHTVTAQLVDPSNGTPLPGRRIGFSVTSGPNAGTTGTCAPTTCVTDASGTVSFSYTGSGGQGDDAILAFVDANGDGAADIGEAQTTARETWGSCGDGTVEPGEQCDPAAATSTCTGQSVCLPTCTCGCASDANCDDGNACNGQERCNTDTHQCIAGTPINCDDGRVCNGVETCNPATGACVNGAPAGQGTLCDADANPCTIDACNGAGACVHVGNAPSGTPCDDGIFCDGTETCDSAGQCVTSGSACPGTQCNHTCQETTRSCFDPAGTSCDDGDAGTVDDACNSAGLCQGRSVTGDFAVLRWNPGDHVDVLTVLGWGVNIGGPVCTDVIHARRASTIRGDAIALRTSGVAMSFGIGNTIGRNLVTGGGRVTGLRSVKVGGQTDLTGTSSELLYCTAGSIKAAERRAEFEALPAEFTVGVVQVAKGTTQRIPASGTFGSGRVVVDATSVRVGRTATLQLAGGATTQQLIVRVKGDLRLRWNSAITLDGLRPEQVIFLVDGEFKMRRSTHIPGTVFGADKVSCGWLATVDGALLGSKTISLFKSATVNLHPFNGW